MRVRLEHTRSEADPEAHACTVELPTVPRVGEWVAVRVGDRSHEGTVRAVLWTFEAFGEDGVAHEPVVRYR